MSFFSGKNSKGFTLAELMAVVMILGILVSMAVPQYSKAVERTRGAEAATLLRSIYDSCERFAIERGRTDSNCVAAVTDGKSVFTKLDVAVKGTYTGSNVLNTENFSYTITYPSDFIGLRITAKSLKGKCAGDTIIFDGKTFLGSNTSQCYGKGGLAIWGVINWNPTLSQDRF
ncbi:MAG: prepilin-type N-terminal cleavage/methylation domain-containing protein [Elusimicrobiaceae bacterium]|nr:prepilin-type N-terminal cleavage/methylation domain-containing protein [Elusimicrobiaceae bacterium]